MNIEAKRGQRNLGALLEFSTVLSNPLPTKFSFLIFYPLEVVCRGVAVCLATATHNFRWVKITNICLI